MSAPTAATIRVLDVPERFRFEIRVDGELAGFTEYRRRPGLIAFTHTLIDPRFEGQGLASRLVQTALSEARDAGLAVLPFCPFVRGYIAGHSQEYLDLVPRDFRDTFELSAASSSPTNAPPASPHPRPVAAPVRGQPDDAVDRSR
ncbi:MAG TPA: GNAT family N-acetyltransferase [Solirubrobacteraceae bacterium]|jgi:hypothetical protein